MRFGFLYIKYMTQAEQTSPLKSAIEKHKEFLFPAVATYYQEPIALVRGEGEYVWDDQGNKYLDAFGGVLTVSIGHANPRVNAAWKDQVDKIAHMSTLYANGPQGDLAEKLAEITPGNLKKSFFSNSGTEADDTAILAAKIATGNNEIVVLRHSYAGRCATALVRRSGIRPGSRSLRRLRVLFMRRRRIVIVVRSSSNILRAASLVRTMSRN